jgi:16S rRNA (uracil1498-N3)-methyltransferase
MLPLFYSEEIIEQVNHQVALDEDASRHIVQVLRMKNGNSLELTNGKGALCTGEIIRDNKREVEVRITKSEHVQQNPKSVSICLSLLKNANRFEWFLEKATELGITELVPLICERTERQHFRMSRMKNILVSAMLQSGQCWLPLLQEPMPFHDVIQQPRHEQRFIAHCMDEMKAPLRQLANKSASSYVMLIGPEGDFSPQEVSLAVQNQFIPVSLGETRLRSETAGVVAAAFMRSW